MRNICVLILLLLLMVSLNSCIISVRSIPYEEPKEVREEARAYQARLKIEPEAKSKVKIKPTEYEIMMSIFDKEGRLIIKAFERNGIDSFEIGRFLKDSNTETLEDFILFLKDNLYKEMSTTSDRLDKEVFNTIRSNYSLLKEMEIQGYNLQKQPLNTDIDKGKLKLIIRDALKKEGLDISIDKVER